VNGIPRKRSNAQMLPVVGHTVAASALGRPVRLSRRSSSNSS